MNALLVSIAVASLGINVGWQRLPEGGMEYIIQLDQQSLEALRNGQPVQSDIPAIAGEVRSYRIVVGREKLPRETPPPRPTVADNTIPTATASRGPVLLAPPLLQDGKRSFGQATIFEEPASKPVAAKPQPQTTTKPLAEEPAKPWLPLTLALFGLFGSLGANMYLGWIALEFRQRCRAMIPSQKGAAAEG